MEQVIGQVTLASGRPLEIVRVEAPCGVWAEPLVDFMYVQQPQYANCSWHRQAERVVAGEFAGVSLDVFFLGRVEGKVAGSCWYATPRDTCDVATFGRVITAEGQRRQGISRALCQAALADFAILEGVCLHLATGLSYHARRLYEELGFEHVNFIPEQGTIMRLVLRGESANFVQEYLAPDHATRIRPLHWGDLARAEVLLNLPLSFVKDTTTGVYANTPYEGQFLDMMTACEALGQSAAALVTDQERLVGLAYCAPTGAGAEVQEHVRVLEFIVHPAYAAQAPELIGAAASGQEVGLLMATSCARDELRSAALQAAGFVREAVLEGALQDERGEFDLYTYTLRR